MVPFVSIVIELLRPAGTSYVLHWPIGSSTDLIQRWNHRRLLLLNGLSIKPEKIPSKFYRDIST